jgi:hypothetical protein
MGIVCQRRMFLTDLTAPVCIISYALSSRFKRAKWRGKSEERLQHTSSFIEATTQHLRVDLDSTLLNATGAR